MKINNVVEKQFIDTLNIDVSKDYKVFYENGKELLVSSRIDIIPKLCYLESVINNYKTSFFEELYKASIEIFSNGNYKEPGNKNKNSFEKYKKIFIDLNNDISKNGFDDSKSVFIKGTNNAILDGGHRAAIAYYHNLTIPYVLIDNTQVNYNLKYFEDRYMDKKYLDYTCLEYVKRKDNIYSICLWQTLNKEQKNEAINYIQKKLNIVYKKDVKLNYNGLKNFMIEIYGHQSWLGNAKNHFKGVYNKVDNCFKMNNEMTCLVVEASSTEEVLKAKKELRDKFKMGNHSIHSTDSKSETVDMLSLLLNDNSIAVLNSFNFDKYISSYDDINCIKKSLNSNFENKVIYGDIILKMSGIKDSSNYKILTFNDNNDDLILNPSNYFYFHGLKFLTIEKHKNLKLISNIDLKLINKVMKQKSFNFLEYSLKIKRLGRKIKGFSITLLKKLKLYDLIKKIYFKVKGKNEQIIK